MGVSEIGEAQVRWIKRFSFLNLDKPADVDSQTMVEKYQDVGDAEHSFNDQAPSTTTIKTSNQIEWCCALNIVVRTLENAARRKAPNSRNY